MLQKKGLIIAPLLLFFLLVAGCTQSQQGTPSQDQSDSNNKLNIVTTTTMITDLVRVVGGDVVEVQGLMGAGIDPHLYKASAGDVNRMRQADLIIYNGLHLEGKMADIFEEFEGTQVITVAITDAVDESILLPAEDEGNLYDPHIWFDVELWQKAAIYVRDALIEADEKNRAIYEANTEEYLQELEKLHAYVKEQVANIPKDQRVLVTAHDAFGYFGRAYDFEVLGLQGISTTTEAGIADMQALADLIAERKIPAIYIETSVPPRSIEALQKAVQAKGFYVAIGGELFSDAMGDSGTPEGTYLGMVRHNVDTIVEGLSK
ncbi:metal ABC transporter solute-binding protein, Zn/Mn family [Heliorestis convoluta]|uniref:Periplasmic zinc-binding protein TroA n=1 Tax=Heliorestis convoluta TaxID=356322 RepID=A0A5Q2N266_9FIRM|nr:zinc ABC transporter substrate-binding protein [Heliorestis convoluta]QGG48391.1 periplasmic zinc-binding protein TroA [Heliorestis convoluta]